MALTFKSKTETIEVVETFNGISLQYRYQMQNGKLSGAVSGQATVDNRQVMNKSTSDGNSFYGNTNELATDDLTGLSEKMKADLVELFGDPTGYSTPV